MIADPEHEEHEVTREWLEDGIFDGKYDPEKFIQEEVTKRICSNLGKAWTISRIDGIAQ
ncbi:hypothetical protein SDC9_02837 [bioreactor metagenome]|uniref:Uncharacterized protein n=1 Tax=bioreactor metagenome TaxID=1076179 RepID=A0A644SRQ2_9ZZZZ